ncbi:MAG: tyrosine--tRNA ligase [Patescibacteria group bacterium]
MESSEKEIIQRNVVAIFEARHLEQRFKNSDKLRVKFGIDPTAPDIHLGHTVALRKLRLFQEQGHQIVFIIGDITAMIGDPSGRSETRKPLTREEVEKNLSAYLNQVSIFLDISKVEVHRNSEWYEKNGLPLLVDLLSRVSVQQDLERDDFQKRIKDGHTLSMLEAVYPILQGYDSVEIKSDVEVGGTDQTFNMLMGRRLQRTFNVPEQDVITLEIIEGLDGVRKMSKSYGNYIALSDTPEDMFGKIMSISDTLIGKYFKAFTSVPFLEIEANISTMHSRDAKMLLARTIISDIYTKEKALVAEQRFSDVFQKKDGDEVAEDVFVADGIIMIEFLKKHHGIKSNSEARRLLDGGGVHCGEKIFSFNDSITKKNDGDIIKIGKRHFYRISII